MKLAGLCRAPGTNGAQGRWFAEITSERHCGVAPHDTHDRENTMSDTVDSNNDDLSQDESLTAEELRELAAESELEATPEQMQALLEFIQDAGGIDEAKTLLERLKSAA